MRGKHLYICPLCKTEHGGWAHWRHHVTTTHAGEDPRYPSDMSRTLEGLDRNIEQIWGCTWAECDKKFDSCDKLYTHFKCTHGVDLLGKGKQTTALSQELGYEFQNYLKLHDDFNREYPESA